VPVDPEDPDAGERDATTSEMLNLHGLVPLGQDADGDWICDCHRADDRWRRGLPTREEVDALTPGVRVSEGRRGVQRFHAAPPEVAEVAWRTVVYRAGGLRSEIQEVLGRSPSPPDQSPVGEREVASIEHVVADDAEMIAEARSRAADGEARRVRVPVCEVADEDVVERGPHPHRFAGER